MKLLLLLFLSAAKMLEPTPSPEPEDETVLQSKKWTYAPFFNQVKRAVAQKWRPPSPLKEPVVLRVTLDRKGSFVKFRMFHSSGNVDIDQAAIDAFRSAQPFPAPPAALLDKDERIEFNFAFLPEGARQITR